MKLFGRGMRDEGMLVVDEMFWVWEKVVGKGMEDHVLKDVMDDITVDGVPLVVW
jgi:hypothetical protein